MPNGPFLDLRHEPILIIFAKKNTMTNQQTKLNDGIYAVIGGAAIALLILLTVSIIRPILNNKAAAREARQQEEVARVKSFLLGNLEEGSESVIQMEGALSNGKKSFPIVLNLEGTPDGYDKISLKGSYRYASQKEGNTIKLEGWINLISGEMELRSSKGAEIFELALNETDDAMEGQWYKYKSKRARDKNPDEFEQKMTCSLTTK